MVFLATPLPVAGHDLVCRGRSRNVVCHCHGAPTSPSVFVLAVLFAVVGLTGLAWTAAATDATAGPAVAVAHSASR